LKRLMTLPFAGHCQRLTVLTGFLPEDFDDWVAGFVDFLVAGGFVTGFAFRDAEAGFRICSAWPG